MTEKNQKTIDVTQVIDASPEDVWAALTTVHGLKQWFVVDARIDPKVGGNIWISWGPGSEGEAPIHAWEPNRHFGWTENYGDDEEGRPIRVLVDFEIEGRDGHTTLRLVQSGFTAGGGWDEMYDALTDGWTYFLFNLSHYLGRHGGKPRGLAWKRAKTDLDRKAAWDRLLTTGLVHAGNGGDAGAVTLEAETPAQIVSSRPGYHFAATLPELDDALLFVEVEGKHIGFWLSTYGLAAERVGALQGVLEERVAAALSA